LADIFIEVELQQPTGNFTLDFISISNYMYHVKNIVIRLSSKSRPETRDNALLVNSHYDSNLQSPGASDDATGVAVLLECLRALSRGSAPHHAVIFNLNGGEEGTLLVRMYS
jgi:hypothetical protein